MWAVLKVMSNSEAMSPNGEEGDSLVKGSGHRSRTTSNFSRFIFLLSNLIKTHYSRNTSLKKIFYLAPMMEAKRRALGDKRGLALADGNGLTLTSGELCKRTSQ